MCEAPLKLPSVRRMATLGVVQGLAAYDYLQDTVDPMIQQLKPRMRIYDSLDTGAAQTFMSCICHESRLHKALLEPGFDCSFRIWSSAG